MGEEQCGFWKGRGCVDQVFAEMQVMEKDCEKNKCVNIYIYMGIQKIYQQQFTDSNLLTTFHRQQFIEITNSLTYTIYRAIWKIHRQQLTDNNLSKKGT